MQPQTGREGGEGGDVSGLTRENKRWVDSLSIFFSKITRVTQQGFQGGRGRFETKRSKKDVPFVFFLFSWKDCVLCN